MLWLRTGRTVWNIGGTSQGTSGAIHSGSGVPLGGHQIRFWPENAVFGRFGPFLGPSGTPRWPSLTQKTVPMHHRGCALTCSTLVPHCSISLEPPYLLMAQKGCFWPFWTLFGALWHTQMALTDPENCSNASPGMCPDLFHPCSTLFHQFGATRSAYGPKRPFWTLWGPSGTPIWPSLNRKTVPIHHWGCALTCSTLVPLCSTSLEPPDPLMAEKGRFWLFWTLFGSPLAHPYGLP